MRFFDEHGDDDEPRRREIDGLLQALDDDIDVAVFAVRVEGERGTTLATQKVHVTKPEGSVTFTVLDEPDEAIVDPMHRFVDRDTADNRKAVTIER